MVEKTYGELSFLTFLARFELDIFGSHEYFTAFAFLAQLKINNKNLNFDFALLIFLFFLCNKIVYEEEKHRSQSRNKLKKEQR